MIRIFLLSVFLVSMVGCKGVSTLQTYPEGQGLQPLSGSEEVYLTEAREPLKCKITKIEKLQVASKTYGGASKVNKAISNLARKKGGNAIINYRFWVAPNAGVFAAPHCEGTVVFADLNCLKAATVPVGS